MKIRTLFNKIQVIYLWPVSTMDHEIAPWKMAYFHGPTRWSDVLENQFTKAVGLSLCVNQM